MKINNNPLVGKIINQIFLAEDQKAIKFVFDDRSQITAYCEGDCCSETWIEDLINPKAAIGSTVLAVRDLDLSDGQPTRTKYSEQVMQYYGCAIDTAKGTCTIEYRNSSNGYYGGSLSWKAEDHYDGVFDQNKSAEKWRSVFCVHQSK